MAVDLDLINTSLASVQAGPETIKLLKDLHIQALSEPPFVSGDPSSYSVALDKFVALDPDKCTLVYLLLRASGARFVVEAGTSFGVSTIYLALAVGQNAATAKTVAGKVIATENEPTKAQKARQHWKYAGDDIEKWIDLREGDLRQTLKTNMPDKIDFLLLDIWSLLAFPKALVVVKPHLRIGATIVIDNYIASSEGYHDLKVYLEDENNGFKSTTVPYPGGLHVAVYIGE